MIDENLDRDILKAKVEMDRKIIAYLDTHFADRVALEHKVRALEFHKAVLEMIDKARADGIINVSPTLTADEVFILLELGVLSGKQDNLTESK